MNLPKKPQNLEDLRYRLQILEGLAPSRAPDPVRLGIKAIDGALPLGGLARGALHEIAAAGGGDAAAYGFAAVLLARIMGDGGALLWCRLKRTAYDVGVPYGLGRFGLAHERILFVEAKRSADVLWAMEEGLRTKGLAAVFGEGVAADLTASRRLQLAAEGAEKAALLLTPSAKRPALSAAATRWRVTALPSSTEDSEPKARWRIELVRCRGGNPDIWTVDWNHEALRFDLAVPLVDRLLATAAS